ncbi:myoferlin-like isoform X3 [Takifugu rubripes]|uniref:myoferlin-like isoform X3 n=1 Tax=Takifugu rubripes TaxID=31033 RepID=UPI0005D14D77|nr:myoferlin-like isoform X3 [Takifugu rubripes]|eukprot:XP_011602470.1 PREDICTED: myoferlin-like isoform X1 [Takifugu rubripes]
MLRIVVESAKGLPKKKVGSPDPVTSVIFKDEKKKTKVVDSEVNPVWNEVLEFDLKGTALDSASCIDVVVKDYETIGKDKFLGSTKIPLRELSSGKLRSLPSRNVPLLNESGQNIGATINLMIGYDPPANSTPDPNDPQDGNTTVDTGGGDVGDGSSPDGDQSGVTGTPSSPASLRQQLSRAQKRHRLVNKPQDFQIRVRIIEARQLSGNNIKPVVKVHVCGQTHRTRIKRGNNPFFDEMFFYNVRMLPSDLFENHISFRVYNSYSLRADSLMGEFKLDVGYVYDEPAHCVMRKWLLLNDPGDSSSGAKGYLKVSLFVVGTGDEPPAEKKDSNDDQDDIESNLLLPAGVTLRWATLSLKVFRAEDIPQMDDAFIQSIKDIFGGGGENKKNLVDPFLEARFAGRKLCTQIIEKNANPEWNQLLNLQIKFPSMCERVKLTVFDWDRLTGNDAVGTTYLNLAKIASSGGEIEEEHAENGEMASFEANTGEAEVGFLPVFGPCFVNLYGSPREFSGLSDPYESLNHGTGEGVAYRGRILVELSTKLEGKADLAVENIPSDDILVVQKYQRRRKFCLCAVFHSATMIEDPGEPIQFEVSIGNYGNKLDNTCKPLASTTQYSCAVFDGNHYYYLPWADTKPVVVVTSFWEDISHRLDTVNIILYIAQHLEANLEAFKTAIVGKVSENQLVEVWVKLLTQLIEDIESYPTPELEGRSNLTSLDIQIKKLRDNTLKAMKDTARRMREEAREPRDTVTDIETWAEKLKVLAEEPQNSMPDVIIWMLRGEKRVAYSRIPAHQVLFSTFSEQACGRHCGKTQTIFLKYPMDTKSLKVPVQIRVNMWFGLSAYEKKFNSFSEGTFSVFAEMYENQANVFGNWGTTGLVGRHKFSDVTGKLKLKQEYFIPPRGWEWESDWFIDPEKALLTEADAGHTEFMDEVFQNETRFPGGEWKAASEPFTDVNGEKSRNPGEFECPPGWVWEDEWTVDDNRAVDDQGWEYGVTIPPEDKPRSWVPAEKVYHVHRRRRLVRPRKRDAAGGAAVGRHDRGDPEGWEFSSLIGWKFHRMERSSDTFRRRRWRRKMAPEDRLGASAIFQLEGALGVDLEQKEKGSKGEVTKMFGANTPTVSCSFGRSHVYHLRVYMYQARNLNSMDKDSFSDPYTYISFLHVSKTTEKLRATLNPTWDQTLIFNDIEIYGDPQSIFQRPPDVVLELYDHDQVGKDELLGRSTCKPMVKLNSSMDQIPKLMWHPVIQNGQKAGETLVAAELILKDKADESDLPLVPPKRAENLYMVPQGIRPVVQLTAVEILAWGLRNMKSYQLAAVSSPSLVVECGGQMVESAVIKNMKKIPNFPSSVLFLKVLLPKDEMYTPPIVIKVIDHRPFGRKPVVGQCTITSLEEFRCDPYTITAEGAMASKMTLMTASSFKPVSINMEETRLADQEKETVDWWSKFYASIGDKEKCGPYLQKGYDTLKVYDSELENNTEFEGFTDFCSTFKLQRGKNENGDDDPTVVGELKGSFKVYPLPDDPNVAAPPRQFRELPDSGPQECLVRVYVIRAIDLQPKDNNGSCDPYIKISLGRNSIDDRDHYIPNTTNPVFGRMFEMTCFLPQEKDLKISVYDYDLLTRDEKVGETIIDLENRFLSRYNSYCGLPQTYCISGINQWRDQLKPSEILENMARLKGLSKPRTEDNGTSLIFNGQEYTLAEFENNMEIHQHLGPARERLCLHVLRKQGLVPEHVESRTLFSTFQPNLSQGSLQMWVDVFPKSIGPPGPPFDVTPRKAKKHFLRVVIWNTTEVTLDETSITGENMSDIYVKGWMPGMEEDKQKTDVHYRSLDGDGNFNWRFVFEFDFLPAEQLCLVSKKEYFWNLDKTEFRIPPRLVVQIWDNDKFSLDDFLGKNHTKMLSSVGGFSENLKISFSQCYAGTLELDLRNMVAPAKTPEKCSLQMMEGAELGVPLKAEQTKSLFAQQSVKGWWPCSIEKDGKRVLAGKVEMSLEIVSEADADVRPAGKGRDEPNMNPKLDPPNRPDTSFFWFTNPCKTMKFIVWRRFRCLFIGLLLLFIVILFIAILLYSLPNYISMKIVRPLA